MTKGMYAKVHICGRLADNMDVFRIKTRDNNVVGGPGRFPRKEVDLGLGGRF
jgi:hypothetical protein